jgi:predicted dehydrogenase
LWGLYPAVGSLRIFEEVICDPEIEAEVIAPHAATHFDLAVRALLAGMHISVEMQMTRSVAEVDEIGRLAVEKNLVAMVDYTYLFNSAVGQSGLERR